MKNNEYLIVNKCILPDQIEQVIVARELIKNKNFSISDACKKANISRSTFYKYKDFVFKPTKEQGNKASLAIKTIDKKGILSSILNNVYEIGANVISINQDTPIDGFAFITLTIDVGEIDCSTEELVKSFNKLNGIEKVDIIGVE